MNLAALPAFTDNRILELHDGREAVVVDPGEAAPVTRPLDVQRLGLAGILGTRRHADHVRDVDSLRQHGAPGSDRPAVFAALRQWKNQFL